MKQMSTAILHMHCSQGSGLSLTSLLTRNLLCALTGRCRCCFGCAEDRPNPTVQAEADDPEAQLQLDPDAWQHKWDNTQAGGDVCLYKLWLAGPPGPVKLVVRCGPHKRCVSLHCLHGRLLVHGFTMLAELMENVQHPLHPHTCCWPGCAWCLHMLTRSHNLDSSTAGTGKGGVGARWGKAPVSTL